ncbi:hypothetical protein SLS62_001718 [Diatrype stigma]|uniref:Uncharacterized protein n=1 Tax=Diatrype stigma TaxID=117547 RepID=A0AAN9YT11_9PEZI
MATYSPDMNKYEDCLKKIGGAVAKLSTAELEERNAKHRQAGAPALTKEEFLNTPHGKVLQSLPPFTVRRMEGSVTPPVAFPAASASLLPSTPEDKPRQKQILEGIKVLELCRVIAGPTIGRSLAALGASVLRINSPKLPDVTFFQVDANTGKHAAFLDLTDPDQRAAFDALLQEADVVIDGYRPGVLSKFGCEPQALAERAARRGKGYVYVVEDCFGGTGSVGRVSPKAAAGGSGSSERNSDGGDGGGDGDGDGDDAEWAHRPGWQQIADCVSGVAWEQGRFMGLDEPVVPPFPMSDYGTGCLGSAAALVGLLRRARDGGSWACRTSLLQYDLFLLSLGRHAPEVEAALRAAHDREFFELRHHDSVDVVSAAALKSMRRLHPLLFDREVMMHSADSDGFQMPPPQETATIGIGSEKGAVPEGSNGFGSSAATAAAEGQSIAARNTNMKTTATVTWPREAVEVEGWKIGHVRPSRANGNDEPEWGDWERDEALFDA